MTARRKDFFGKRRAKLYGRPSAYGRAAISNPNWEWVARRRAKVQVRRDGVVILSVEIDPPPERAGGSTIEAFVPFTRRQARRLARWLLERTGWREA